MTGSICNGRDKKEQCRTKKCVEKGEQVTDETVRTDELKRGVRNMDRQIVVVVSRFIIP